MGGVRALFPVRSTEEPEAEKGRAMLNGVDVGMRRGLTLGIVIAAVVVAGCQRGARRPAGQATEVQVVNVVAKEFAFEPKEIRTRAGKVRFIVTNEGAVEHEFMIERATEHGEHAETAFKPGVTHTVEVDLEPGTYEVTCNLPGHKDAGMVATLIVE